MLPGCLCSGRCREASSQACICSALQSQVMQRKESETEEEEDDEEGLRNLLTWSRKELQARSPRGQGLQNQ